MAHVILYTTLLCPFCYRAKMLLEKKGVCCEEIDVGMDGALRREMSEKAGGAHTVPQIFINARHIGGCDDLFALENAGTLDALLSAPDTRE